MEVPRYANTITITANPSKNEFTVTFSHRFQSRNEETEKQAVMEAIAGSVVITRELVEKLPELFSNALEPTEQPMPTEDK